jgi:phenylpropionate dioxygenase-like ring-hydroxylating dioxygenase large terminal subunit
VETLPWSWYTDPEILRREHDLVFRRHWQYVGHTGALAEPGSFFAASVGEIPVAVVRGRDGRLRAFLNVCRHRGFPVVRGSGRRETLQCAYHAWTYDLDGSLRAAPRAEREAGFDGTELGLVPVAVDTWGPFVFVAPDRGARPLAEALGPLPGLVAELLDVDALRFRERAEWEVAANWKVACENFLECYHCPVAHPGFSELVDVSPDAYALAEDGLTSTQLGPLRRPVDGELQRSQFHFLWPATGINIFPGRPNLSIGPMLPAGPERTRRYLDYFFAEDADDAWVAELMALDGQVGAEDTVLVEGVQSGVRSGMLAGGRLLPESERLVAHFQRLTAEALTV